MTIRPVRFRRSILRTLCLALTAWLVVAVCLDIAVGRAEQNPRLIEFLEQFEALRTRERAGARLSVADRIGFGGPWSLYHRRPFENGLSGLDLDRHLAAQTRRDCSTVAALERRGFLALYPFLSEAFARSDVVRSFEADVLPWSDAALGFRRCRALAALDRALDASRRDGFTPNPVDVRPFMASPKPILYDSIRIMKDLRRKGIRSREFELPPANKHDLEICGALQALSSLAVNQSYVPALKDILKFLLERRLLIYSRNAEYYLLELARRLGVRERSFEDRWSSLRLELGQRRRKQIDATVADRSPLRVDWPYVYCSHIDLMTRLEASGPVDD